MGAVMTTALSKMIQNLQEQFSRRLMGVAVYGSYARGTARLISDIDLLVVVKGLPRDWEVIHRMEEEWMHKGRRLGKRFHIVLASPEDVEDSVEWAAPLMLEVYDAYEILFDQDSFFRNCMRRMEYLVERRGIQKRRQGVWEVPEHVITP